MVEHKWDSSALWRTLFYIYLCLYKFAMQFLVKILCSSLLHLLLMSSFEKGSCITYIINKLLSLWERRRHTRLTEMEL